MITLATLAQATEQEVFDQAAKHLLRQNKQAKDQSGCVYRIGNLQCAGGCFISKSEYNESFEGSTWDDLIVDYDFPKQHKELILSLQRIHDDYEPEEWKYQLLVLSEVLCLNQDALNQFKS